MGEGWGRTNSWRRRKRFQKIRKKRFSINRGRFFLGQTGCRTVLEQHEKKIESLFIWDEEKNSRENYNEATDENEYRSNSRSSEYFLTDFRRLECGIFPIRNSCSSLKKKESEFSPSDRTWTRQPSIWKLPQIFCWNLFFLLFGLRANFSFQFLCFHSNVLPKYFTFF